MNVLIALIDRDHVHHLPAHQWFQDEGSKAWATCPLTENGALRILGHPRYPNSPGTPASVVPSLMSLRRHPGHEFWADDASLLDPGFCDADRLLRADQITDTYLLALARTKGGLLASFDRRLGTSAVRGGAVVFHPI